jgi:hypothetical protein
MAIAQLFLNPDAAFPCSEEPSTDTYPEPTVSSPHRHIQFRFTLVIASHLYLGVPSCLFL